MKRVLQAIAALVGIKGRAPRPRVEVFSIVEGRHRPLDVLGTEMSQAVCSQCKCRGSGS